MHVLLLSFAVLATAAEEALAFALPRVVWCRVDVNGAFDFVSPRPDGPAVPHGATMAMPPVAYYYPRPTRLLEAANRLGIDPGVAFLVATGRETTTRTGHWREFRRASAREFDTALAKARRSPEPPRD